jgi:hypothetical protein
MRGASILMGNKCPWYSYFKCVPCTLLH